MTNTIIKISLAASLLAVAVYVPYAKETETNNPSLTEFLTGHLQTTSMHAMLAPFLVLYLGALVASIIGHTFLLFGFQQLTVLTAIAEKTAMGAGLWWLFMMIPIPLGMAHVAPSAGYWLIGAGHLLFSATLYFSGEGFAEQLVLQK